MKSVKAAARATVDRLPGVGKNRAVKENYKIMNIKKAELDNPILSELARRWSPYCFEDRMVSDLDLRSLFEAARWAASSYNEQPWNYIVATKENGHEFAKLLSCLADANQSWAKHAAVLVLCVASLRFAKNARENRAAVHDLGLADGNLVVEATDRGLSVHQMIGIFPELARDLYRIPAHYEAWTAMAIGYKADPSTVKDEIRERDLAPRTRKLLNQFVFAGQWGNAAPLAMEAKA